MVRLAAALLMSVLAGLVLGCGARAGGNDGSAPVKTPGEKQGNNMPPEVGENPQLDRRGPYYRALAKALRHRGMVLSDFCDVNDEVARRIIEDYGAIYLAKDEIHVPPVCMFTTDSAVDKFQSEARFKTAAVGGVTVQLQPAAMDDLLTAESEAKAAGLSITPKGGRQGARRSYDDTQRLWDSRFLPALAHWQKAGKLSAADASRLKAMPIADQVREVLQLEKRGLWFSKDLSKSILYSVAAPGTSQHIAMLALDLVQYSDAKVRRILANHGWFQTVKSDQPHFTYLGRTEQELPGLGLRQVTIGTQAFWIPDTTGE